MQQVIANTLGMTAKAYSLMTFEGFVYWCELNSNSIKETQTMASNQKLYNWYINQMQNLELIYYDKISPKKSKILTYRDRSKIYVEVCSKIGELYPPKQLLKAIKQIELTANIN